ncbi:phosphoglycolate phosphatase [Puniceibacterium sp. IMCC21224]|uniref:phosphoglycolate phosphatase n=1 Tax=Puniceibacterium sp. IMCC21224 TaxID=1618204 RepID=UPI00064D9F44|nr:phosphoglycolate phosphatase [Puniceibacterium sp. IMCC21224]KMK66720.1 2-phosphoglycolate phosphatase [Puniceibacterium sp. IMCC21224]
MLRTVVFDLDGTLVHSAPDLQAAANRMLADLGAAPLDMETVISFIGRGVAVLVRRCLTHVGLDTDPDAALAIFEAHYARDLTTLTRPYPGAEVMLATLRDRGLTLGLCTNKPEGPARALCDALNLTQYFDVIVGGDTLTVRKPDPDPLWHVITALGGKLPETLYVGDSETDYLTARRAGVLFAFFEGGYQPGEIAGFKPNFRLARIEDLGKLPELNPKI